MKMNLSSHNSTSERVSLAGAIVAVATAVVFLIYGIVYDYFDTAVLVCLLLGCAGLAVYTLWDHMVAEFLNLAAVACLTFGLGLFVLNSYTVWADWYGNFNMYGSRGGIVPVIILIVLMLICIVCGIISCFTNKKKEGEGK